MEVFNKKVEIIKLSLAVVLVVFGCILLMMGFWVAPAGIIDSSVLVAFGECLTFSGCLAGISYAYSIKHKEFETRMINKIDDKLKEKEGGND